MPGAQTVLTGWMAGRRRDRHGFKPSCCHPCLGPCRSLLTGPPASTLDLPISSVSVASLILRKRARLTPPPSGLPGLMLSTIFLTGRKVRYAQPHPRLRACARDVLLPNSPSVPSPEMTSPSPSNLVLRVASGRIFSGFPPSGATMGLSLLLRLFLHMTSYRLQLCDDFHFFEQLTGSPTRPQPRCL